MSRSSGPGSSSNLSVLDATAGAADLLVVGTGEPGAPECTHEAEVRLVEPMPSADVEPVL